MRVEMSDSAKLPMSMQGLSSNESSETYMMTHIEPLLENHGILKEDGLDNVGLFEQVNAQIWHPKSPSHFHFTISTFAFTSNNHMLTVIEQLQ